MAHVTNSSVLFIATEATPLKSDAERTGAMHYKQSVDRDTQMTRYKDVEAKDDLNLKLDWKSKTQLSDDYAEYRDQLLSMLSEFQFIQDGQLGQLNIAKHRIELTNENILPIHSAPYRVGPKAREFEKAKINKMFLIKFIEPAQTELAAPTMSAPKKHGLLRFRVNHQKLNADTKLRSYRIFCMSEYIEFLGVAAVLSMMDVSSRYWQVEAEETDNDKTAFTSYVGLYRLVQTPFGLEIASGAFQRAMNVSRSPVKWQFALVYFDDLLVFLRALPDHINHVK